MHKEFKINKMPRKVTNNESMDNEIKASLEKLSDKNSEGNSGGLTNNMFVNVAKSKTTNQLNY